LSRSALHHRFVLLFRVKPEVEVVETVVDPRQIFGRYVIPLPYRPVISDAGRAEFEDCGLKAPGDGEMARGQLRARLRLLLPIAFVFSIWGLKITRARPLSRYYICQKK